MFEKMCPTFVVSDRTKMVNHMKRVKLGMCTSGQNEQNDERRAES